MKRILVAPTARELAEDPVVTLTCPRFNRGAYSFNDFAYPIRFSGGTARVLEAHFDAGLGDKLMAQYGIEVTRPEQKKEAPVTRKPATRKKVAPKTTATQKVAAATPAVTKPTTKKRSSK